MNTKSLRGIPGGSATRENRAEGAGDERIPTPRPHHHRIPIIAPRAILLRIPNLSRHPPRMTTVHAVGVLPPDGVLSVQRDKPVQPVRSGHVITTLILGRYALLTRCTGNSCLTGIIGYTELIKIGPAEKQRKHAIISEEWR